MTLTPGKRTAPKPRRTARASLYGAALLGGAQPAVADVRDGIDAWSQGDFAGAVAAWRPAAEQGDADAQFNLAQAFLLGRGVTADRAAAAAWFRKAALQHHVVAAAKYALMLIEAGQRDAALPWLDFAARRGEPRAQLALGMMLFNGDGVAADWPRAYALLVRSAAADTPYASEAQAQMDKVVPVAARQQGLGLARQYEAEARRPQMPSDLASARLNAVRTTREGDPAPLQLPPVEAPRQPVRRPPASVAETSAQATWSVQLGAFSEPANARRLGSLMAARFEDASVRYERAGAMTRVLVGPYTTSRTAMRACGEVKPCVAIQR